MVPAHLLIVQKLHHCDGGKTLRNLNLQNIKKCSKNCKKTLKITGAAAFPTPPDLPPFLILSQAGFCADLDFAVAVLMRHLLSLTCPLSHQQHPDLSGSVWNQASEHAPKGFFNHLRLLFHLILQHIIGYLLKVQKVQSLAGFEFCVI